MLRKWVILIVTTIVMTFILRTSAFVLLQFIIKPKGMWQDESPKIKASRKRDKNQMLMQDHDLPWSLNKVLMLIPHRSACIKTHRG